MDTMDTRLTSIGPTTKFLLPSVKALQNWRGNNGGYKQVLPDTRIVVIVCVCV